MPYAEVNDIRMYYEEEGEGEPLVLLHGALGAVNPTATSGWVALNPVLATRYRTFSLEHRGHGKTNNPSGALSYVQLTDDVVAFIEQRGLGLVHLAGMSLGAEIGLAIGRSRPDLIRTLVSVGANYRIDERQRAVLAFFDAAILARDEPEFARILADRHDPHHYHDYWRDLVGQIRAAAETGLAWTEDDLRAVATPTLLIAGEADEFDPDLQQILTMRRSIPRAELLILNHAGLDGMANHRVQHTRAEIVGPVMLDFLERHRGG